VANESVVAPFLVALKGQLVTRLAANPTWAKSTVYMVQPQAAEVSLDDCIVLVRGSILSPQTFATNTRSRNEDISAPGFLQAFALLGGDQAFIDAMGRAQLLLNELIDEVVNHAPGVGSIPIIGQRKAIVEVVRWRPFPKDAGGWGCRVYFNVNTSVRVA
jgi:hypothetical protein